MIEAARLTEIKVSPKKELNIKDFDITPANKKNFLTCIDGRPSVGENGIPVNIPKIPGGFWGLLYPVVATLKEANNKIDYINIVKSIINFETENGRTPTVHSDTHSNGDLKGCGFFNHAFQGGEATIIKGKIIKSIVEISKENKKADIEMLQLKGDHLEDKILINNLPDHTVRPKDKNSQIFVIDLKIYKTILSDLAGYLNLNGIEINKEKVLENADNLAQNTLDVIAKRLPIWQLNEGEGKIPVLTQVPKNKLIA